jgi:glutamate synthase domain-containing protein 2
MPPNGNPHPPTLRESATFGRDTIAEIQRAAREGIYDIRGVGAKRKLPHFDDPLFLGASVSRYPLEGYRERCATDVTIGTRFAREPIHLDIPITIAGMSFGALSGPAKEALGRGATEVGTSTTTGDGGMTPEEREHSRTLVYQLLPSRYGMNPDDLRRADAIEVVIGQGAKPGGGGMLLGHKISDRVAEMRDLPAGIDQRSACRHPDWTGPDDLEIKIEELREITDWRIPIYIKIGASRTYYDVAKALALGADAVSIGVAAMIALGDNAPEHADGYAELGSAPGYYDDWQAGRDPAGISTQEPELAARLDPVQGGRRLATYLRTAHPGDADAGPRVRQVRCPQPRARGPGSADDRGGRDGPRALGRHDLDPWPIALGAMGLEDFSGVSGGGI